MNTTSEALLTTTEAAILVCNDWILTTIPVLSANFLLIHYLKNKPLGQQTLLDSCYKILFSLSTIIQLMRTTLGLSIEVGLLTNPLCVKVYGWGIYFVCDLVILALAMAAQVSL